MRDNEIDAEPERIITDPDNYQGSQISEIMDARNQAVEEWFEQINSRQSLYTDCYPFEFDSSSNELTLIDETNLNEYQKLYLALLLSSNLDYAQGFLYDLTNWFEVFCHELTWAMLPAMGAENHRFGKGRRQTQGRYTGNIEEKIQLLAQDLCVNIRTDFLEDCARNPTILNRKSTGDKGLDIVSWISFEDKQPMTICYFGQCACGIEWEEKQFELHSVIWDDIFQFKTLPTNVLFIPRSYRFTDGRFFQYGNLHQTVMIDRLRLIKLAQNRRETAYLNDDSVQHAINYFREMHLNIVD